MKPLHATSFPPSRDRGKALGARLVCVVLGLLILSACSRPRVHYLSEERYSAGSASREIRVLDGEVDQPFQAIALMDSQTYLQKDEATQERMRQDLIQIAQRIGADAIRETRVLSERKRGALPDERIPIPMAWKQGRYKEYFMRGEAIRFLDQEKSAPDDQSASG
ncbi:hypothetical protein HQ520_10280 [bacterium]|nr:hypothetical protein [bacterium]